MDEEVFYVIYNMQKHSLFGQFLRVNYEYSNEETNKLIYNGYSQMVKWSDATLFKSAGEAFSVIDENIEVPDIDKRFLKVLKIVITKTMLTN